MDLESLLNRVSPLRPLSRSPFDTSPHAIFYYDPVSPSSIPAYLDIDPVLPPGATLATLMQLKHLAPLAPRGIICDFRNLPASSIPEISIHLHKLGQLASNLPRDSRVVIISPPDPLTSSLLAGFTLSLSKECARDHKTVNMVTTSTPSTALPTSTSFFLSGESAFITGQIVAGGIALQEKAGTAVVTGAGGGIGRSIAYFLSPHFDKVLLTDHETMAPELDSLGAEIGNAEVMTLDVTAPSAGAAVASAAGEPIAALVHAAGITMDSMMKRMTRQKFERVMEVDYNAIVSIDQHLLKQEMFAPRASVVMVSSVSGVAGNAGQVNYSTAKSGLLGYAEQRTRDVDPDIAVWNNVAPGFIDTPMVKTIPSLNKIIIQRVLTSMQQKGKPADVAAAVRMLSRGGGGLRGQCLRVCGGMIIGR